MKFTEEQIDKVVNLRTELVETLNAFEIGMEYGKKIFEDSETGVWHSWTNWINQLRNNILDLEIEEKKIADTDISGFDEADFYVSLGRYFEQCYNSITSVCEGEYEYFYSKIGVYKENVMEALKK